MIIKYYITLRVNTVLFFHFRYELTLKKFYSILNSRLNLSSYTPIEGTENSSQN